VAIVDFQFNVSLGREVELYNRVDSNDPANSALIMMVLAASGLEDSEVLRDKTDFANLVSGTTNEVTNTGYARKTLTDTNLSAYSVDHTANSILLSIPVQTFASISAGDAWAMAVLGFDSDTTAGTDANIIPITGHVLKINNAYVVPNSGDIVVDLSAGFVRARQ
jgi:hypothetical protein